MRGRAHISWKATSIICDCVITTDLIWRHQQHQHLLQWLTEQYKHLFSVSESASFILKHHNLNVKKHSTSETKHPSKIVFKFRCKGNICLGFFVFCFGFFSASILCFSVTICYRQAPTDFACRSHQGLLQVTLPVAVRDPAHLQMAQGLPISLTGITMLLAVHIITFHSCTPKERLLLAC